MPIERVKLVDIKNMYSSVIKTWNEVDQRKDMGLALNPDWGLYEQLEESGRLFVYTVGSTGYASFILSPDLHRKGHFSAVSDVIYIKPEERGILEECLPCIEKDLKGSGADHISVVVKTRSNKSLYDYTLYEETYQKVI